MVVSVVEIFNMALSACGVDGFVAAEDENTKEAKVCRMWYPSVRDNLMAAAPWASVKAFARLALLATRDKSAAWTTADPNPQFLYAYALPADLAHPYHLQSYARFSYDLCGDVRVISTDEPTPILHYSARRENVSLWEQGLQMAIIHTLATHIARPVTGRSGTVQENAQIAMMHVEQAQRNSANGEDLAEDMLPDWIAARGYNDQRPVRFFYPFSTVNFGASL